MKLSIYALAVFLFACTTVFATEYGSLTGTVIDDKGSPLSGASVKIKETGQNTISKSDGSFKFAKVKIGSYNLIVGAAGYQEVIKKFMIEAKKSTNIYVQLAVSTVSAEEVEDDISTAAYAPPPMSKKVKVKGGSMKSFMMSGNAYAPEPVHNTESYNKINDNEFKTALDNPLSTFSIDVDAASYSNMRRFLNGGSLPPKDAVRAEELINYFHYDYPNPNGPHPFSITSEVSTCPWNEKNMLVHIGLQGKKIEMKDIPPSNLVFLLDVSGSMNSPNKLPLLKSAFKLLLEQLREQDRVAICVYAGAAGLVLPSTPCSKKQDILDAIDKLSAGGSTAGGAGIKLAYKTAFENLIVGGNNRVILATDGDFNVGASSDAEMTRLIENMRKQGVFITCLGFGMGNYKDSKMEAIADKGNGNYAYIDNIMEAKKVLVNEIGATLFTIAKDVKIQVEFNPAKIKSYRLIGYVNRLLNKEDFEDDTKDAGELGAGHTVTALYEVVPADAGASGSSELRYSTSAIKPDAAGSDELMTVKFRYKEPDGDKSKLIEQPLYAKDINLNKSSDNFRFSAAVAEFSMLLRDSEFKGNSTYSEVIKLANGALGQDMGGYRREFIKLVEATKLIDQKDK